MNWDAQDYRVMKILYLPKHVNVAKGDSVFTSGFNNIYPEGIYLGNVNEIQIENNESFHDVSMKLVNDFSELKHAFVIENKRKVEILEMEKFNENE